jgi:nucleoside-diphosphate-sugar epimerase
MTEKDWADEKSTISIYTKVKVLQERLAWETWKALPEQSRFELVVLCLGNVIGPTYKKGEVFATVLTLKSVLDWSKVPGFGFPKLYMQFVDVRDVAVAHLKSAKIPKANR